MEGNDKSRLKFSVRELIEFLVLPILSAGVFILWDLNKNVNSLNVQVGILIANTATNEKRVDSLENRIENLEQRIVSLMARKKE